MNRSLLVLLGLAAYIGASYALAFLFPQSVLAFLLMEGSLLLIYYAPVGARPKVLLGGLVLMVLLPLLGSANAYYLEIGVQIGIYVALALGLNIVVSFVGLLNLGFVAFYAIGAYLWAIFGSPHANQFIAGGFFPLSPNWFFVFLIILVTRRLENSRVGRAWKAIREDEVAANAMGVPVVRMKLLGFAVGASFASAVGVLFAAKQVFINPESFTFMESIGVLAMVILGGMGSIPGAILGATGVTILNLQLLKGLSLWLNGLRQSGAVLSLPFLGSYSLSQIPVQFEPAKYERMVFGLILILMMIFRPQGILPPKQEPRK